MALFRHKKRPPTDAPKPHLSVQALAVALALAPAALAAGPPISVTDETGTTVTFEAPIDRVAAFNAYNGEFVRAVAGVETLVGMDRGALRREAYWPDDGSIAVIGENQREPSYEPIVELAPEVVILPRNGAWEEARETLATFDIPVLVLTGWDPLRHTANVAAIGAMTGHDERAAALNAYYTDYVKLLEERLEDVERRTIFVEHVADYKAPIPGSGWHDMIVAGGGASILAAVDIADQPAARGTVHELEIEPEAVLGADPEVVVKFTERTFLPAAQDVRTARHRALLARPGWTDLQAVKNGEVYTINSFAAGGCSKIIGSLYIAKWLYPELFEDVDPDEVHRAWLEDFQGVKYHGGYVFPPGGDAS